MTSAVVLLTSEVDPGTILGKIWFEDFALCKILTFPFTEIRSGPRQNLVQNLV